MNPRAKRNGRWIPWAACGLLAAYAIAQTGGGRRDAHDGRRSIAVAVAPPAGTARGLRDPRGNDAEERAVGSAAGESTTRPTSNDVRGPSVGGRALALDEDFLSARQEVQRLEARLREVEAAAAAAAERVRRLEAERDVWAASARAAGEAGVERIADGDEAAAARVVELERRLAEAEDAVLAGLRSPDAARRSDAAQKSAELLSFQREAILAGLARKAAEDRRAIRAWFEAHGESEVGPLSGAGAREWEAAALLAALEAEDLALLDALGARRVMTPASWPTALQDGEPRLVALHVAWLAGRAASFATELRDALVADLRTSLAATSAPLARAHRLRLLGHLRAADDDGAMARTIGEGEVDPRVLAAALFARARAASPEPDETLVRAATALLEHDQLDVRLAALMLLARSGKDTSGLDFKPGARSPQ